MERAGQQPLPAAVKAAQARVAVWRKNRQGKQARMPEALWDCAAQLAKVHGINPIARALGLDYYNLKRRVGESKGREESQAVPPVFLDLGVGSFSGSSGCVVEMEASGGAKVTVRLPDPGKVDLVSLGKVLWKRRR